MGQCLRGKINEEELDALRRQEEERRRKEEEEKQKEEERRRKEEEEKKLIEEEERRRKEEEMRKKEQISLYFRKLREKNPSFITRPISEIDFERLCKNVINFSYLSQKQDFLEKLKFKANKEFTEDLIEVYPTEIEYLEEKYIYQGAMDKEGNFQGYGKLLVNKNKSYYEGMFENNCFHGNGILISSNGDYYIGSWRNGQAFGQGEIIFYAGDKFQGRFQNNRKEGKGKESFRSGDTFEGYFHNNEKIEGEYKVKNQEGKEIFTYNGKFLWDQMNDEKATCYWEDNRRYTGGVAKGKFNGKGEFVFPNGEKYNGLFEDDKKNGEGIYSWENGDEICGTWNKDQLNGEVNLKLNGQKLNGKYEKNKIIEFNKS